MPTIYRSDGFRIAIYPNDHEPAHVHVFHGDGEVKINLGSSGDFPSIVKIFNMPSKLVVQAFDIVLAEQENFIRIWREIHE
ncbi:MAG: DUF4160 domain-containing protein [Candidatus Riflebacteria bacterium]|nr:DUF4160 domain-containing protein [Candidatus Riflebacteria bacterium]